MKVRRKSYIISREEVLSLTHFFLAEKAEEIRMVYNGTSRVFNEVLWDPHFTLPNIYTHEKAIKLGTSMGVIDTGKMFLNFMMHKRL